MHYFLFYFSLTNITDTFYTSNTYLCTTFLKSSSLMASQKIQELLADKAEYYLGHECKTISKDALHTPSADVINSVWKDSNRNVPTLRSIQALMGNGRLANTGYVSILPVDQGIEHSG